VLLHTKKNLPTIKTYDLIYILNIIRDEYGVSKANEQGIPCRECVVVDVTAVSWLMPLHA
jgi:hypothetical protein